MKIIILYFISILFIQKLSCQEIELLATSEFEVIDTVIFGFKETATLGIDSALDENDILGTPYMGRKIRILQRDSVNFSCLFYFSLQDTTSIYIPEVFDSRINFRDLPIKDDNRFFEFSIGEIEATGGLLLRSTDESLTQTIERVHIHYGDCMFETSTFTLDTSIVLNQISIPAQSFLTNNQIKSITVVFRKDIETSVNNPIVEEIFVYPNPTQDRVYLNSLDLNRNDLSVYIYDISGKMVQIQKLTGNNFSVINLSNGFYSFVIKSDSNTYYKIGKFVIRKN